MTHKLSSYLLFTTFLFSGSISHASHTFTAEHELDTSLNFKDQCSITLGSATKIVIRSEDETLFFDETDKPVFNSETGESVVEYSGVATDGNQIRSWAKAVFQPSARSEPHFHNDRVEDYYIITPNAHVSVLIDGVNHTLKTGDHITIPQGTIHQVLNLSDSDPFSLIVKCAPSWIFSDHTIVKTE
jgi:mannose-6-phosphate isomerase-like protein (cupin superfamily)